jgi:hypothetical protein
VERGRVVTEIEDCEAAKESVSGRVLRMKRKKLGKLVPIYIPLKIYEDGAQTFKKRAVKFVPFMTSILNLPPSFRSVVGVGMFLLGISSFGEEHEARNFLIRDCFIKEMMELYHGVELVVTNVRYFIQARVILHGYDTKGLQPVLRVRGENAKLTPCPLCRHSNTYMNDYLGTVPCYENMRHLLPLNHWLRAIGQTQQCCPHGQHRASSLLEPNVHARLPAYDGPKFIHESKEKINQLRSCEEDLIDPKEFAEKVRE